MPYPVQRVAVLGARQTGKTWLAQQLMHALSGRGITVTDGAPLLAAIEDEPLLHPDALAALVLSHRQQYDLTLLLGLDLPCVQPAPSRESVDAALRAALGDAGVTYKVIYGSDAQRLENARLALEGPLATPPASRTGAQFGLQGGRVAWQCGNCSDPDCEHRMFTRLL